MSRLSFGLMGQDANQLISGMEIKIKNEDTGQYVASTNPTGSQVKLIDNNDGTYYVDGLPIMKWTVYVGSSEVPQEELQFQMFFNEDVQTHLVDDEIHRKIKDSGSDPTDLWSAEQIQSELDGKEDVDATILKQADIVDNLTSSDVDKPLSAAQGKALQDGKEGADTTILKQADIVDNLTSTDVDKPLSAAQGKALQDSKIIESVNSVDFEVNNGVLALKDRSELDGNYISDGNSIAKNLGTLDDNLYLLMTGKGQISWRTIYDESKVAAAASGSTPGAYTEWQEKSSGYVEKIKVKFAKRSNDFMILFRCEAYVDATIQYTRLNMSCDSYQTFVDITTTAWAEYAMSLQINQLTDGLKELNMFMGSMDNIYYMHMRNPVIEVQTGY